MYNPSPYNVPIGAIEDDEIIEIYEVGDSERAVAISVRKMVREVIEEKK